MVSKDNNVSWHDQAYHEVVSELPKKLQKSQPALDILGDKFAYFARRRDEILEKEKPFLKSAAILADLEQLSDQEINMSSLGRALAGFLRFADDGMVTHNANFWQQRYDSLKMIDQLESSKFKVPKRGRSDRDRKSEKVLSLHHDLLKAWRKHLDIETENNKLYYIKELKDEFMESFEEWIEHLKEILILLEQLGMDPGYFLDFTEGSATLQDMESLRKMIQAIGNNKAIKEICDILGRIMKAGHSNIIKHIEVTEGTSRWTPDCSSKGEIKSIELGNDIERVIPSELSLLADPEASILFDLKFAESQLMCFKMEGYSRIDDRITRTVEKSVPSNEERGPFIICIDTSGSMHGTPENIAKAISFHLVNLARREMRDCYLISFSMDIDTLDFSSEIKLSELFNFLGKSFHRGTDLGPAIRHSMEMMKGPRYTNADVIILSDFIMDKLPEGTLNQMQEFRNNGSKFHSLCISSSDVPNTLKTQFDRQWVYDPWITGEVRIAEFTAEFHT